MTDSDGHDLLLDCEQSLFCSKIPREKVAEHESRASGEAASSARGGRRAKRETAINGFIQLFTILENKARTLELRAGAKGHEYIRAMAVNVSQEGIINSGKHSNSTRSQISAKEEAFLDLSLFSEPRIFSERDGRAKSPSFAIRHDKYHNKFKRRL